MLREDRHTIYVGRARSMSDEALRGPEEIVEADAEADFLDDLYCLFRIQSVLGLQVLDLGRGRLPTLFAYLALRLSSTACTLVL